MNGLCPTFLGLISVMLSLLSDIAMAKVVKEVLKRIQVITINTIDIKATFGVQEEKNVDGVILLNSDGIPLKSTLEQKQTIQVHTKIISRVISRSKITPVLSFLGAFCQVEPFFSKRCLKLTSLIQFQATKPQFSGNFSTKK